MRKKILGASFVVAMAAIAGYNTYVNQTKVEMSDMASAIERCFVTGVSPVTMDDVTSGFNIGTNYSLSPEFNGLMGFTEEDVRQMLDYYRTTCEFHHTTN